MSYSQEYDSSLSLARGEKKFLLCALLFVVLFLGTSKIWSEEGNGFSWQELDDSTLELVDGNQPVWDYVYRQKVHPWIDESEPRRVSGCYFDPVFGLDGEVLTIGATVWDNHQHHHGIWPSFSVVLSDDGEGNIRKFDLWTDNGDLKRDFVRFIERRVKNGVAHFAVENGWFVNGKEQLVREKIEADVYPVCFDEQSGRYRSIDFSFEWSALKNKIILTSPDRSFSSMTIRFSPPVGKPTIRSIDGDVADDQMQFETPWLDYRAVFGKTVWKERVVRPDIENDPEVKETSIAIFPLPQNPKYSGGWAFRHYGMICSGWPGKDKFELLPGSSPVRLKYRIVIHDSEWTSEEIQRAYETFCRDSQVH